jgi:hypothetical protein
VSQFQAKDIAKALSSEGIFLIAVYIELIYLILISVMISMIKMEIEIKILL